MRRIFTICSLLISNLVSAQTTEDYTVELSATVQTSPPKITLQWKRILTGSPGYMVFKKAKGATSWGAAIATLTTMDSIYVDNSVIADSAYEYQVIAPGSSITSSGYIFAGIKNPAIHNRGTMVLLVDSTFTDSCKVNIGKLMNDMRGDGWQIVRYDLSRTLRDTAIRSKIRTAYNSYPNVKAVMILGHLAVPYSGALNPDGHPDHYGAWPADVYYGNVTSTWTDVSVNDTTSSYVNDNIPGDGKWDQTAIPAPLNLQVSRIDFYNMPAFTATEVQLMNSYLGRDHVYKMDSLAIRHRGLVSDNFGAFGGEAFAQNSWRNFAPLVGKDSISAVPFISSLASSSYQWAYGCGGGTFTSAGGIGSTTDFTTNPVNGIFTMLFGSYFGDWNVQNSFLRAPLCASTPALTNCWAGRPNWFLHHMALGENIGYSALLTQNNGGMYQPTNFGYQFVHVALMGDLTLRTDYIKPISNLAMTKPYQNGAFLTWTASPDATVIGYYVYRADSAYGFYKRVSGMLTATNFHDSLGVSGLKYYMVRPVKLQNTPSGGYYNLGVGVVDTGTISFKPVLVASVNTPLSLNLYPNPAHERLNVKVHCQGTYTATMFITNISGQVFNPVTRYLNEGDNNYSVDISELAPGIYTLCVNTGDGMIVRKWVKE